MLIDSHLHLTDGKFNNKEKEIILEAKNMGVVKFITIGTSLNDNEKVLKLTKDFSDVFGVIGVYPHEDLDKSLETIEKRFRQQIDNSNVIGVGECGIDKNNWGETRELEEQKKLFKMQIEIALENKLPLIIHNREGDLEVLEILNEYKDKGLTGIAHCFVSSWEVAKKFIDLGFYISFSGIITFASAKDILETVKNVPLDRFLVETDAPYLAPQGHRGEVNVPKYVRITAQKIAEVKNISLEEIETKSYQNTCTIFKLKDNNYDDKNRE